VRFSIPAIVGKFVVALALVGLVSSAPAEAQSTSLARYAPSNELLAYAEFDGIDAHKVAWKKTAAYRLLNETTLGVMLEELASQGFDKAFASAPGADRPKGAQAVKVLEAILQNGFAVGLLAKPPEQPRALVVIRNGARGEIRAMLDALLATSKAGGPKDQSRRGRTLHQTRDLVWWVEKTDVVLINAPVEFSDKVFDALEGKIKNAVQHPIRVELTKRENGIEPVLIAFADPTKLPGLPPDAKAMGLDGVKRLDFRWGFQNEALVSNLRVIAPKPRKGVLALFDQPTFGKAKLPPLPASLTGFMALSIDADQAYDQILAVRRAAAPQAPDDAAALDRKFRDLTGLRLREDVLARLGPQIGVYLRSSGGVAPAGPAMQLPEVTIVAQIDDANAFGKTLDTLAASVNKQLKAAPGQGPKPQVVKLAGGRPGYFFDLPPGSTPIPGVAPTFLIAKGYFIASSTKDGAEQAASAVARPAERWAATGPFQTTLDRLPPKMVLLNVSDPRATFPAQITGLPNMLALLEQSIGRARQTPGAAGQPARDGGSPIHINPNVVPSADSLAKRLFPNSTALAVDDQSIQLVSRSSIPSVGSPASSGVMIALLLPALQSAREAARRAQCTNNLKQIGLAMHNYHSVNNAFPPAAVAGKTGKPLLSWRVALLPYLEQNELYKQFHLDEPWDSPHNKTLIDYMPAAFACPSTRNDKGMTTYRTFVGPRTAFEGLKPHTLAEFLDGTSNTLLVVESTNSVPWTKPDDLPFDPNPTKPLVTPGSNHPGGFNALFADGTVRFIKLTISQTVLRALITRNGGEIVQAGAY
jgi:prepilin-type processing-associated H-X9-DG protein